MKYTITLETIEEGVRVVIVDEIKQQNMACEANDIRTVLEGLRHAIEDREPEFMEKCFPGYRRIKFKEFTTKSGEKMDEIDTDPIDVGIYSPRLQSETIRLKNLCQILLAYNRLDYGEDYLSYELYFIQHFPERWDEPLSEQGVQRDDYDYAILCDRKYLRKGEDGLYGPPFLNGCCENKWYEVVLDGREWALGVAYHG